MSANVYVESTTYAVSKPNEERKSQHTTGPSLLRIIKEDARILGERKMEFPPHEKGVFMAER